MTQPVVSTYPYYAGVAFDACVLNAEGKCTRPAHAARHYREAQLANGPVIRAAVLWLPGAKTKNGKPTYSLIVFHLSEEGTKIHLSGRSEWGVCMAVALTEVKRLREAGDDAAVEGGGIVWVPPEYGLRHPIIAYRTNDRWLGDVRGFYAEEGARAWTRTTSTSTT